MPVAAPGSAVLGYSNQGCVGKEGEVIPAHPILVRLVHFQTPCFEKEEQIHMHSDERHQDPQM